MCADSHGRPYIASYWKPRREDVPQYNLTFHDGSQWNVSQITNRKTPFSLQGGGTKRIPISRPRIIADSSGDTDKAYLLFRDSERDDRVSVAICKDLSKLDWKFLNLTEFSVGMWEPSYDTELWQASKTLHIYVQKVGQGDGEKLEQLPPTTVSILKWIP